MVNWTVYAYFFHETRECYVGVTLSTYRRQIAHRARGTVSNKLRECKRYTFTILQENIPEEHANKIENKYMDLLKESGWNIISKKTNTLGPGTHSKGTHSKETLNKILKIANEYPSSKEFRKNHSKEYKYLATRGFLNKAKWYRKENGGFSNKKVKCLITGKEFQSMSDASRCYNLSLSTINRICEKNQICLKKYPHIRLEYINE